MSEAKDPHCLSDSEIDKLLSGAPWRRFVVMGDSHAEGLGDPVPGYRSLSWADRTAEALRRQQPDLAYLNLGQRNLSAGRVRDTQLAPALDFGPDLAVLHCGGNDLLGHDFDAVVVAGTLEGMIVALRDVGADVVMAGLIDLTLAFPRLAVLHDRMMAFNEAAEAVAHRHGALFIDKWTHPAREQRDLFSRDMLHPSMRGHAVSATELIKVLSGRLRH
ncbi:SGNH/GDSL hydrolase family protein [Streptomyces sp. LX-29]|uniref:SGNH/GDSL hydrolase family protein n=1 Tax=Streptomyces sp. LX-29 TaxID=2900152 RepID=UPI00240D6150|nr:SGNH/GDSL hydrolase family protein [Streptomyces sp. LX-29]WFB09330.1 SGNH/GDSL hydrolase family protein [Streptomyces sp. LX-29]